MGLRGSVACLGKFGIDVSNYGTVVGKDTHDIGVAFHFFVEPFEWVVRPDFAPVGFQERGGHELNLVLGNMGEQVPGVMHFATLSRRSLKALADRGLEALMSVRDHQPASAQSSLLERAHKRSPECGVFEILDVDTEDLTVTVDSDPCRDHHRARYDLAERVVAGKHVGRMR